VLETPHWCVCGDGDRGDDHGCIGRSGITGGGLVKSWRQPYRDANSYVSQTDQSDITNDSEDLGRLLKAGGLGVDVIVVGSI